MDQFKNILILIIFSISITSCTKKSIHPLQNIIIDAGPFSVSTTSDFKLVQKKGIDSYVGIITNGKIEFSFDYGWYSNRGPLTYYDYAEKYLFKLNTDEIVSTCEISDSLFQIIRANPTILDAKRNPLYPNESDKEISVTIGVETGTCTIYIFNMIGDISQNFESYEISETINYDLRRKQYLLKAGKERIAGVYIEDLKDKRRSKHMYNKLSFITHDLKESNAKLVKEILKSAELNTRNNKR